MVIPAVVLAQPKIPHTLEGREGKCTNCHSVGAPGVGETGGMGMPADHKGRTSAICLGCHQAAAAAPAATPTPAPAKATATPTPAPAKPAPTPTPTALPKTGGAPILPIVLGSGSALAILGWSLRRLLRG
jgi:hypothetical protein